MEPIENVLHLALAHLHAGEDAEAANLYRGVLGREPDHSEALHLLGLAEQRLGELDAYVPIAKDGGAFSGGGGAAKLGWMKDDYQGALDTARAEGKLVFVNFTGYACTNCHWMKANMFTRPEIYAALGQFVLVELYTDGTDAKSEENQLLQESKFQTIAIPYYAILTPDGEVVASFPGLTREPAEFLAFLETPVRSS